MTPLDAAVVAFLVLISAGGYYQGFIRGLTRLAALAAIGLATVVLSLGIEAQNSLQSMILRTLALFGAVVLLTTAFVWLINRAFPHEWHAARLNKVLGIVPALFQGLIIAALLVGLVHRLALEQEVQRYIGAGIVTGPLTEPLRLVEQSLAGVR
jgi:uncharacterized membrane protein required for colicin V production